MSSLAINPTPSLLQNIDKKVMITIIGFLVAAIIGAVSFASAAPEGKPTKEECAQQGFRNYGQCVSNWAHSKGYGG